jgi:autoinducer 2-degrading protein
MFIVHVYIHVKADQIEGFKAASIENAKNSLQEPGVARFDLIQQADDPTRFMLVEVYRTPEDAPKHKETAHYNRWREVAEPMLAEPRMRIIYSNIFPDEKGWDAAHAL